MRVKRKALKHGQDHFVVVDIMPPVLQNLIRLKLLLQVLLDMSLHSAYHM